MKLIDLTGKSFGRLRVIERSGKISGQTAFLCKCECGNEKRVRSRLLLKGDTTSCGCFRADKMRSSQTRHGLYNSPTYRSYRSMLARCTDAKHKQFKDYGGRGITVCDRWSKFENFLSDMGERPPGKTLDRIENDLGYLPGNCQWSTRLEQNNNKRNTHGKKC